MNGTVTAVGSLTDKLSVILALKGREAFTPRWIDFHDRIGLPWPVIVGDGAPSDRTEKLFQRATHLRASYRRYNDSDLFAFYRKLHDLVSTTVTPYVLLSDNDDFILPDGIVRSIEFLDMHSDYASCSGMILGVYITDAGFAGGDPVHGGTAYRLQTVYPATGRTEDSAETRVTRLLRDYVPTWYSVHRREALLKAFHDLVEKKISDIAIMELLVATELAALGKQKVDWSYASYLRQMNSSQRTAVTGSFFEGVLKQSVKQDVDAMAVSVSAIIARAGDATGLVSRLRAEIMDYRDSRLNPQSSASTRVKRLIGRYLHTARAKVHGLHGVLSRSELHVIVSALRAHGATGGSIAAFRKEMNLVFGVLGKKCGKAVLDAAVLQGH